MLTVYRKNLYQQVFEYDYPLMNPEPKEFIFLHPSDMGRDFNNDWKESFKQLVSAHI